MAMAPFFYDYLGIGSLILYVMWKDTVGIKNTKAF